MIFTFNGDMQDRLYIAKPETFDPKKFEYCRGYLRECWLSPEWTRAHLAGTYEISNNCFALHKTRTNGIFHQTLYWQMADLPRALSYSRSLDVATLECDDIPGAWFAPTGPLAALVRVRHALLAGYLHGSELPGVVRGPKAFPLPVTLL